MRYDGKCVSIKIVFEDGRIMEQEGEAAHNIWKYWISCESLNAIHGGKFEGEPLKTTVLPLT